ncbi:MAG: ECF transporter S component [Bacillota bacterium]
MNKSGLSAVLAGAVLTAMSLIIPLAFGGVLGIVIPPFSATLASHVPVMLAMLFSPWVAAFVGIGSAIGFLIRFGPVIAARAAMHAIFGFIGATLIQGGKSFSFALAATAPIHALLEALVVIPFGFTLFQFLVVVGVGTLIHHSVDSVITLALVTSLQHTPLRKLFGRSRPAT